MLYINIDDVDYLREVLDNYEDRISRLEDDLDRVLATLEAMRDDGK